MLDIAVKRLELWGYSRATIARPRTGGDRRPRVSVVVPCYNYGHFLPECVDGILGQAGVDVDVLIVDDASTDGSQDVVRRLVAADDRVRAILHERNSGHIATYNEGLGRVDGDYVVLLSADDLLTPGALQRSTDLMEANPSVGLAYGGAVDFSGLTPPPARTAARTWTLWRGRDWLTDRCRTGRNALRSPEAVMRTAVLRRIGGYREELPHAADFELWMRAAAVADVGYVGGADQAYYRVHEDNMHDQVFERDTVNGVVLDLRQRRACFEAVLAGQSGVAGSDELLDRARRSLAAEALSQALRWYWCGKADQWPVEELVAFARDTCPPDALASRWRALNRRRTVGPRWSRRNLIFRPTEHLHRVRYRTDVWRWQRAGV
jgi:glycosyltransferase involved in cell wall biosynthesis